MNTSVFKPLGMSLALFLGLAALVGPSFAVEYRKKPVGPRVAGPRPQASVRTRPVSRGMATIFAEKGPLSLSVDAVGTELSFGTVEVAKPAGAVVRRAYLVVAATGEYARSIDDGEVRVDGHGVIWDSTVRNGVGSWNALADVTRFVESQINSAPPGRVLIDYSEDHSDLVDGTVLAVVFEDRAAPPDNFLALYFGAQGQAPDSFTIDLPRPVPPSPSDGRYELGLGISYSLQSSEPSNQYTIVEINGRRLTTSAGGPDDGSPTPGALVTVGGIDDSPANPADAFAPPVNLASDDELYDLRPLLAAGDTSIVVKTSSPSEENVFFASLFSSSAGPRAASAPFAASASPAPAQGAYGPQGIVLSTASSRTPVGSSCEISASVTRDGLPLSNALVELRVVAGPHAGAVTRVRSQESGTATFLYRGKKTGRDVLVAILVEDDVALFGSNTVTHDWIDETLESSIDVSPGECPNRIEIGAQGVVTVGLAGSESFDVGDVDITSLSLGNATPLKIQYRDVTRPMGSEECACSDEGGDGYRDIVLQFTLADILPDASSVADGQRLQWTLSGSTKSGKSFRLTDCVVIAKTPGPPASVPDDVLSPVQTEELDEPFSR